MELKKSVKLSVNRLKTKTENEINQLNLTGLQARKNRFSALHTEVNDILNRIINMCEANEVDVYYAEEDDVIDVFGEMRLYVSHGF